MPATIPSRRRSGPLAAKASAPGPGLVIPAIADHPGVAGVGDHEAPRRKNEGERAAPADVPAPSGLRLSGSLRRSSPLCAVVMSGAHRRPGRRKPRQHVSTTPTIVKTDEGAGNRHDRTGRHSCRT